MRYILAAILALLAGCSTPGSYQVADRGVPAACADWSGSRAGRVCPWDHP
ncbi:MAG: hypothetical protein JOZ85_14040 [Betaproteobacteria bacterium]|nr:hypothetical protein [Betaproteobacteria bacterium]